MNTYKATIRLILEDAVYFFGRLGFLYITLPLFLFWSIGGAVFKFDGAVGAISAVLYVFVPIFAVEGFKNLFRVAMSMGSTRTVFLKAYYLVGTGAIILSMVLLNILQLLLVTLFEKKLIMADILHYGRFLVAEYDFITYLLIDILISTVLFGLAFLLYCIYYRIGMKKLVLGGTGLTLAVMLLYYSGALNGILRSMTPGRFDPMLSAAVLGTIGLVCMFSTYPLMRNAPLTEKTIRS